MEESGTPPAPPSLNAACRNLAVEIVRSTGNQDFPLMPHPRTVAFGVESDLREPVATWLCHEGFDVRMEVPILGRRADLVGSRGTTVAAIEMKMHRWVEALRQAIAYQLGADLVWVAMPLADASRAYRQRWTFEAQGVGLLAVDDRARFAGPSARQHLQGSSHSFGRNSSRPCGFTNLPWWRQATFRLSRVMKWPLWPRKGRSPASSLQASGPLFRAAPCSRRYPQANRAIPTRISGTPSSHVSNANMIAENPMRNTPTWVSLSPRLR